MADVFYSYLKERSILRLSGDDSLSFLQSLTTNNIDFLSNDRALYSALLTPQGKILYDFFICNLGKFIIIECDTSIVSELHKKLLFYRLRADVSIENASEHYKVLAIFGDTEAISKQEIAKLKNPGDAITKEGTVIFCDPRMAALGLRIISDNDNYCFGEELSSTIYNRHSLRLGVATGSEIEANSLFPHDCNIDLLNGIDFNKGCYIGQEVISRIHHKSEIRKRIIPFILKSSNNIEDNQNPLKPGVDITLQDRNIGSIIHANDNMGLALIRLDSIKNNFKNGILDSEIIAGKNIVKLQPPNWLKQAICANEK